MGKKIFKIISRKQGQERRPGFTLAELLVASTVMLIVIVATLALYMRSNKVAVDQSMYAELQHDVRSAMFFIARDIRMAGVGLPIEFNCFYFEGTDNEDQGAEVTPDRLLMMGNIEDPLNLSIDSYPGNASVNLAVEDYSYEQYPYPDAYYDNKVILILPNPSSACRVGEVRIVTNVTHSTGGTNERINFSPGLAPGINPPGGLSGSCPNSNDYEGGLVTFIDVKEFWLDVTGNYPGLIAGVNGYIGNGQGGILYMTLNAIHYPLAQNVENLQFEYNGDLDNDGSLDGFLPWADTWTPDQISRIREIRIYILGQTPRAFVSVSGTPPADLYLYERPSLSNTSGSGRPDRHKRFLLESTSVVRNLSLNLYNTGTR
jgi:prepilin-type N-terminal cleavage/methylation domain-containing protein